MIIGRVVGYYQVKHAESLCWIRENSIDTDTFDHVCRLKIRLGTHHLRHRGPFSDLTFLATKHVKMAMIVIRISARAYIHSLSCIVPILVEMSDRWVVSDVWSFGQLTPVR